MLSIISIKNQNQNYTIIIWKNPKLQLGFSGFQIGCVFAEYDVLYKIVYILIFVYSFISISGDRDIR